MFAAVERSRACSPRQPYSPGGIYRVSPEHYLLTGDYLDKVKETFDKMRAPA
jgi:hypothetical protein